MTLDRRAFLRNSLAAAAFGTAQPALLPAHASEALHKPILQARGLEIVQGNQPVRLRGLNLGGWMLIEDYMIGLPWTEWKIREQFRKILGEESYAAFFNALDQAFLGEEDVAFLASKGFNVVRLPFNYRHFESDLAPGKWLEAGFRQLDRAVGLCQKHGIWVVLDLHAAPGAQARDQNAGSAYGESYLWNQRNFLDRSIALWAEIARRYRGDATVAGYNLLCEPVTGNVPLLNEFYLGAIRAIRAVDPEHIILLDPNLWAKDIASLRNELFADPQVIPVLHHYYSEAADFSALTRYPSTVGGKTFDRASLAHTLDGKFDQQRIPRPTMVSEFGVSRTAPQPFDVQLAITRDLISIFEERGWGWSAWCYKDLHDMGLLTVRLETPWRRFLDSPAITSFMKQYRELEEPFAHAVKKMLGSTDVDVDTREQWGREVSRDFDVAALDFILRRLARYPAAELEEMAHSFAFSSCEVHQNYLGILTEHITRSEL